MDRGIDSLDLAKPRFFVNQELERRISTTASDMQNLLGQASDLIEDRDSHFVIDPGNVLLPALRGCSSISELVSVWNILRGRLRRAQAFFDKYDAEYRGSNPTSPSSTNPEVYQTLKDNPLPLREALERLHREVESVKLGLTKDQLIELSRDPPRSSLLESPFTPVPVVVLLNSQ